jgi:hypothetical protein
MGVLPLLSLSNSSNLFEQLLGSPSEEGPEEEGQEGQEEVRVNKLGEMMAMATATQEMGQQLPLLIITTQEKLRLGL